MECGRKGPTSKKNRQPPTPWGYLASGISRKKNKYSDCFILHCRK